MPCLGVGVAHAVAIAPEVSQDLADARSAGELLALIVERTNHLLHPVTVLEQHVAQLVEALGEREPDAPSPRRVKDLIEEELLARRRDLFSALDLVFFDTTSLFFTGNGGDTLGRYGKSKDHRSDCC